MRGAFPTIGLPLPQARALPSLPRRTPEACLVGNRQVFSVLNIDKPTTIYVNTEHPVLPCVDKSVALPSTKTFYHALRGSLSHLTLPVRFPRALSKADHLPASVSFFREHRLYHLAPSLQQYICPG